MTSLLNRLKRWATAVGNTAHWRQDAVGFFIQASRAGPVVELPMALAREHVFAINHPDAVTTMLNSPELFTKDTRGQELLRVVLGVGLLTSEGKTWRERRRIAQPAFRKPKLSVYRTQMLAMAEECRDRLLEQRRIDVGAEMMRLTLDIATVTLFSDRFAEESQVVSAAMEHLLSAYVKLLGNPLPHPERLPTRAARAYRRAVSDLSRVVLALVRRRRSLATDGDDLMHLWIHSGLDDDAVRDEVITMLLAAHETTANLLSFALCMLSKNPGVRRRLQQEVADQSTPSSTEAPLLDAVLKETLRLYPPAWITARSPNEDTTLAGVSIPKGSLCLIPIHALQNDPNTWPNPQGFDPDRWKSKPTGVWMPFGAGQRKCIGSNFAMLEARVALTTLINGLDLDLEPEVRITLDPSITMRPAQTLWARVRPRG